MTTTLPVASLEVCDRVRVRNQRPKDASEIIQEYTEAYQCGLLVEPLHVFRENGTERYVIADGEHRLLALRRANIKEVEAVLHDGDEVDALDFAADCNHTHGVRLTKKDRFHIFQRVMETPRLKTKYRTDTELSEKLRVALRTIASYKAQWRDSESTNKRAASAKQKAKDEAERNTRSDLKGDDASCIVKKPEKSTSKKSTRDKPPPTPAQKAVAKQVRESLKAETKWGPADEHAYKALKREWARATNASREKFRTEICG